MPNPDHVDIYEVLFSIDYNVDKARGKFFSDLSFAYLQWNLSSQISVCRENLKMIDYEKLVILCVGIMPGCRTFLHLIAMMSQELQFILKTIPVQSPEFEMPFIQDLKKQTPLHISIA